MRGAKADRDDEWRVYLWTWPIPENRMRPTEQQIEKCFDRGIKSGAVCQSLITIADTFTVPPTDEWFMKGKSICCTTEAREFRYLLRDGEHATVLTLELAAVRPCGGFVLRGALWQACVVRRLFIL